MSQQIRGTFKSKATLRVQFSPALGVGGGGKGLKPKLLLGFTKAEYTLRSVSYIKQGRDHI